MNDQSTPVTPAAVGRIATRLAPTGLNRCQAVLFSDLDRDIWLPGPRPPWANTETTQHRDSAVLLLVGQAGPQLWRHLNNSVDDGPTPQQRLDDPFDTFSAAETGAALSIELPSIERRLLYPRPDCPVDLVSLGQALGWQSASPLGLGIHPEYGLWSAFRALWLLDAPGPNLVRPTPPEDVCASCATQDCVAACPAAAVEVSARFNLEACFGYRAEAASRCAETCLSRRACPVGPQHQYSAEQMAYHYLLSRPQS